MPAPCALAGARLHAETGGAQARAFGFLRAGARFREISDSTIGKHQAPKESAPARRIFSCRHHACFRFLRAGARLQEINGSIRGKRQESKGKRASAQDFQLPAPCAPARRICSCRHRARQRAGFAVAGTMCASAQEAGHRVISGRVQSDAQSTRLLYTQALRFEIPHAGTAVPLRLPRMPPKKKRASGRHPMGSRAAANGKPQPSGWRKWNKKLDEQEAARVQVPSVNVLCSVVRAGSVRSPLKASYFPCRPFHIELCVFFPLQSTAPLFEKICK